MSRGVVVRGYRDADRERWQAYVSAVPSATLYHDLAWKDIVERSFGHETYYLLATDGDERLVGVCPLVYMRSLLFGKFLVSLPYVNYGGICADTGEARRALLDAAVDLAARLGAAHLEVRQVEALSTDLPVKMEKVSMRLPLPAEVDHLWRKLGAKLRSQVRRPEKEGMRVTIGGEELLPHFYRVFARNMRDLGTPVYGIGFFENVLATLGQRARICTVFHGREPVASGLLVRFRDTVEIPWASSIRTYNRLGPNMLLYWTALKHAVETGAREFDFGRSTPGSGTYRFKEQWGAQPVPLRWYYWVRNRGPLPALNPSNPKYRLAIETWRRLPVSLTRAVGPRVARNLP